MRINVRVKPRSKVKGVVCLDDGSYQVLVNAPAKEGKANAEVVEALAEYFDRPKSSVNILKGTSGRHKIVEIL